MMGKVGNKQNTKGKKRVNYVQDIQHGIKHFSYKVVLQVWGMGQCKPHEVQQDQVLHLTGATQSKNAGWEKNGLRADMKRGTWSCCWMRKSKWPNTVHLQSRKPTVPWAANLKKHGQHVQEGFCPSILLSWDPIWCTASSPGDSNTRSPGACRSEFRGGTWRWSEAGELLL